MYVGIDVGGTNLKAGLVDEAGRLLATRKIPLGMDSIPKFIACAQNPKLISYLHPSLEPILSITYGCILYQEQVIEIFRRLAGYSLGQADMTYVRKSLPAPGVGLMRMNEDCRLSVVEGGKPVAVGSPSFRLYRNGKLMKQLSAVEDEAGRYLYGPQEWDNALVCRNGDEVTLTFVCVGNDGRSYEFQLESASITKYSGDVMLKLMEYGKKPFRRIRLDALTHTEEPGRERFLRRMAAALREEAVAALRDAKTARDALEAVYSPYVDFDGIRALTAIETGRLLSWRDRR